MTKRIQKPATTTSLLADLVTLVCDAHATNDTKTQAISIAYEIGKGEGRVAGAEDMGNTLMASLLKSTAPVVA
jgi:hypothetical protein